MITGNLRRMMCALLALAFLFAGCAATSPQPTEDGKPAFSELIEQVEAQRSWCTNNQELAALFQSERERLGERFEVEVIKFLGDDSERHYWISLYLCQEYYLHGQRAMPYLALAIKQQGIELSGGRKDFNSMAETYSLSMNAAVLAKKLGMDALAREHKKRAVDMLSREPLLAGASPAMGEEDRQLYKSITVKGAKAEVALKNATVKLQKLIDETKDGQTLRIPRARYIAKKGIVIKNRRNLRIICEWGTEILVDDVNEHVLMIEGSRGITIDGALLRHKKPLTEYNCHGSVVFLQRCDGITLIRCDLNGCGAIGVNGRSSKNIIVRKCLIHKNTFCGFYLDRCADVKITDNIIEYNGVSIKSHRGDALEMYNNLIRHNGGYWEELEATPGRWPE